MKKTILYVIVFLTITAIMSCGTENTDLNKELYQIKNDIKENSIKINRIISRQEINDSNDSGLLFFIKDGFSNHYYIHSSGFMDGEKCYIIEFRLKEQINNLGKISIYHYPENNNYKLFAEELFDRDINIPEKNTQQDIAMLLELTDLFDGVIRTH